jgi:arylsulfatase A-like enzyme
MSFSRAVATTALVCLIGCARAPGGTSTIRLVDRYTPESVEGQAVGAAPSIPRTEWRFDGQPAAPGPTRGWEAASAVADLAVRDGRLEGRTTGDFPVVHVERTQGLEDRDLLHAIELRLRVSAGANLAVSFRGSEKLDVKKVLEEGKTWPWRIKSPLVPGPEPRTYTLRSPFPTSASEIRHLLVRPTDAAGARFAIESVRLVFRKEYLASIASGVSWQGLSEVYRETLVSRSPETLRFALRLPARPVLDLAVGTIEDGPVTFRVTARPSAAGPERETVLLERTVTKPHRWEAAPVDLGPFAGRAMSLGLSVSAEKPGTLAFWGAPAVRGREARGGRRTVERDPPQRPQGVILIWADTLRRDHLSAYGYPRSTSPVLDRMAREGTLFRDCIGQATWTKVATPSLLTSLYPTTHGVREFTDRLPSSAATLAEAYREAGYATVSYSSILFTGRFTNLHQGFEEVHEDGSLPDRNSSKTAREYVDRLLPWLEAHRDVPFFVFLHVADPHDPYRPYAPYDSLWADPAKREAHERDTKNVKPFIADPLLRDFGMPSWVELEKARLDPKAYVAHDRDWYDGAIRGMDTEIGRLLERLPSLGLAGRTLVVFTSDHGEEFLDHGRTFHGQSVYGELTNMALIVWRPGAVPAGAVVERRAETIDVMPTLLEMSGLAVPKEAQGRSLVPLIASARAAAGAVRADSAGGAAADRPAISEKAPITDLGGPPPRDTHSVAIISGDWKLIANMDRPAGDPEYELYDHRHDPLDQTEVSAEHKDVVERLAAEIQAWKKKATAARLKPDGDSGQAMTQEELERLRALGYIQ